MLGAHAGPAVEIDLFDVDGTLTYNTADRTDDHTLAIYQDFAFWEIVMRLVAANPVKFWEERTRWKKEVENCRVSDPQFDSAESTHQMMQRAVKNYMSPYVNSDILYLKGLEVGRNLIRTKVVRIDAIAYLKQRLEAGIMCILTTGSYYDSLRGFVTALQEEHLLPPVSRCQNLLLFGVEIDWQTRTVTHTNVGQRKAERILKALHQRNITKPNFVRAFGDDPFVNDAYMLDLAKEQYIIHCARNRTGGPYSPTYKPIAWDRQSPTGFTLVNGA